MNLFDIVKLEKELQELENQTTNPDFWNDSKKSGSVLGKIKNIFKPEKIVLSNGKKVFPEEIEALINKIDIVEESMVYEDNDKICAEIVYSKDNMEKNNLATVDDVRSVIEEEIKIINKNLPIYKYIREFSLTDVPLIKTTTQKIKRHEEMKKIKGE